MGSPDALVPLPPQPAGVPWPTEEWPTGPVPDGVGLEALIDEVFADEARYGTTYALVVVHRGVLVAQRYGGALPHWDAPDEPVQPETPLLSWSMAKSVVHAATGILVRDQQIDPNRPVDVPDWRGAEDPRRAITLEDLLAMRDGLDFAEDYVDGVTSDVIHMLFGEGQHDVAAYATARPLAHPPGDVYNYSSGTTNIVARALGDIVGGGEEGMRSFLAAELFDPIGMRTARPRFDDAGTFIGSSYVYATARDFARFGLLYLRDGVWDGKRILPEGWVDHGRRQRSTDTEHGWGYGAHWWVAGDEPGGFWASGYEGQSILCVPALDLVSVRLGRSEATSSEPLREWRDRVTTAFAAGC